MFEKPNVLNMQNTSPYMVWISFKSNMMNKTQHGKKRSKVARQLIRNLVLNVLQLYYSILGTRYKYEPQTLVALEQHQAVMDPLVLLNIIFVSNNFFKVSKLMPKSYENVKNNECVKTCFSIVFSKVVKSDDHGFDVSFHV